MVYPRSVITAILAVGAVSSVLAVPVPMPSITPTPTNASPDAPASVPTDAPATTPPTSLPVEGHPHHGHHPHNNHANTMGAQQNVGSAIGGGQPSGTPGNSLGRRQVPSALNLLNKHTATVAGDTGTATTVVRRREHEEYHHHHRLEKAMERVDLAKERLRAAEHHLHDLMEDEDEFVSKHRLHKAEHRLQKAKHRLNNAEEHLHDLKHKFEEGEFERDNIIKHEEAPVAFEIAIAPRGVTPTTSASAATPTQTLGSRRRALYGDDLN